MDANETRDTLQLLTDALPAVADRLGALLAEESAATAAAEEFLQRAEERQAEATDLLGRIEAVQLELRAQVASEAERLDHWQDPSPILHDPELAFEEKAALLVAPLSRAQALHVGLLRDAFIGRREEHVASRSLRVGALRSLMEQSGDALTGTWQVAGHGTQVLQHTVEISRTAVAGELERLGSEIEALQGATARDAEEMRRDVEGYDDTFVSRLERVRQVIREDAERMLYDARERLSALRHAVEDAVEDVGKALRQLDDDSRQAERDAEDARDSLVPLFDHLEERLEPLRQAVEAVREAAGLVGIPF